MARPRPARLAVALGVAAALGAAAPVRAGQAVDAPGTAPELVVRADLGPPLWRVARGGSELVILGTISPIPSNRVWNTAAVADALRGARVLLLSPGSTPGVAWADHFPEWRRYLLGQSMGHTLSSELSPEAAERFSRTAAALSRPLAQYSGYRPGPAGMRLLEDSWRDRGLTGARLEEAVIALAWAARVHVVKVDEGGSLPLINAIVVMTKEQHAACAAEVLDQIEREGSGAAQDFRAWANGDLPPLRDGYRPVELCLDSTPGGATRRERAHAAWLHALIDALAKPGRTVAMMDVSELLEPSDLLAALRTRGATVAYPRGEPATHAGPALTTVADRIAPAAPLDVFDPLPGGLQLTLSQPAPTAPPPPMTASGRKVDLAASDVVCVKEAEIGTLVQHTTCHTRREWREIEAQRALAVTNWQRLHSKLP